MTETLLSRRQFCQRALKTTALLASSRASAGQKKSETWLFSACDDYEGRHYIAAWPAEASRTKGSLIEVPLRAHSAKPHPTRPEVIFFARRPGTEAYLLDYQQGRIVKKIQARPGYHYYGHACYSADGQMLYATENPYGRHPSKPSEGQIGVYDSKSLKRLGEFPTGGIGPHELIMMPDKRTIALANGGIFTHPDHGREKLNTDVMQSSLVYLDARSGTITQQLLPSDPQMSIRHLDCNERGQLVMGTQYQGPAFELRPSVLMHQAGSDKLVPMRATASIWRKHEHYIASISVQGSLAVSTAPRGGVIDIWQLDEGRHISQHKISDCAGTAAVSGAHFYLSNGRGEVFSLSNTQSPEKLLQRSLRWDNHLSVLKT